MSGILEEKKDKRETDLSNLWRGFKFPWGLSLIRWGKVRGCGCDRSMLKQTDCNMQMPHHKWLKV